MKKHIKLILSLIISVILVLFVFGCSDIFDGEETTLSSGEVLGIDAIESIIDAQVHDTTEKYPTDTYTDGSLIVYWLKNGGVWHKSLNCQSVSSADKENIFSGTINEAIESGKTRGCKNCSSDIQYAVESDKNIETTVSATHEVESTTDSATQESDVTVHKYPKEYLPNGKLKVYWLSGGSVWHESRECQTVRSADANVVKYGTVQEAYYGGKLRPCKTCSYDSVVDIETITTAVDLTTAAVTDEPYPKEYDSDGNVIVYWLTGGSVWHESRECQTVRGADASVVKYGTVQEAYYGGKLRPCKTCSYDSVVDIETITTAVDLTTTAVTDEPYPKEYDSDGNVIVYWLTGGSVWHESRECSTVKKADPNAVISGNAYDAYYAGKTRACKVCAEDSAIFIDENQITAATSELVTTEQFTDTQTSDTVYWVKNGSVWHVNINCSSLKRTSEEDIISGSIQEAEEQGKERACKRCS